MTSSDGVIYVMGTRVPLETIVTAFDSGATAEEITQQYPTVDLASVYSIISYILDHRATVDEYVARRRRAAADLKAEIESRSAPGFRQRLLARRSSANPG